MHTVHTLTIDLSIGRIAWHAHSHVKDDPSDDGLRVTVGGVGDLAAGEESDTDLADAVRWVAEELRALQNQPDGTGVRRAG